MTSGALEKLVEHWLTRTKERGYQLTYCQLLVNQGFEIIYISTHGPSELGKDIVALDKDGVPHAFQLKIDDISLARWRREVWPEVEELLELELEHPRIRPGREHVSYLVTTGELSDPVVKNITQRNKARRRKRQPLIRYFDRGYLLRAFTSAHQSVLPWQPADYQRLFDLYVLGGNGPLNKEQFAAFLSSVLPFGSRPRFRRDVQQALSSALILVNYALEPYRSARNHWAVADAWTMTAAYVLAIAGKYGLAPSVWEPTYQLAINGCEGALGNLRADVVTARDSILPGLSDGEVYRERATLLIGYLGAYALTYGTRGDDVHKAALAFFDEHKAELLLWGESAIPHWLMAYWLLVANVRSGEADRFLESLIEQVLHWNRHGAPGLINPYYDVEAALRNDLNNRTQSLLFTRQPIEESFSQFSYSLRSLVLLATRRGLKQYLRRSWRDITHVFFMEFFPDPSWTGLLWRSERGEIGAIEPHHTQTWSALQEETIATTSGLAIYFVGRERLLLPFLLAYPHRVCPTLTLAADEAVEKLS